MGTVDGVDEGVIEKDGVQFFEGKGLSRNRTAKFVAGALAGKPTEFKEFEAA